MKHIIALAVALSFGFTATAVFAQSNANPAQTVPLKKGSKYSGKGKVVTDYNAQGLKAPPKGFKWVKDGSSFLLLNQSKGTISEIKKGKGH